MLRTTQTPNPPPAAESPAGDPDAAGRNRRGIALFVAGEREAALREFREAIALDGGCAVAWNNLGLLLQTDGRLAEAVEAYTSALAARPDYPEALTNRGSARHLLGDREGSRSDHDRALACAEGPYAATVLHNRAALNRDVSDTTAALADLDRALEIDPRPETLVNRAEIRKRLGDLDGALADLDRALADLPRGRSASARHLRGGVSALRDDFRGALADYDLAIAIDPANSCFHVSRGHARYHLRDRRALDDYRVAFGLDPAASTRDCLALFADDARRRPRAVFKNCAQHLRLDPDDGMAYLRRGMTLVFLAREDEAGADFERARSLLGDIWEYARLIIHEAAPGLGLARSPAAPVTITIKARTGPLRDRPRPGPAPRVSYSIGPDRAGSRGENG